VNLSTDVGSIDLIKFCDKKKCLYLDTCVELWPGGYFTGSISGRSNYAMREKLVELKKKLKNDGKEHPTMVSCFGANPGIVSCFVKQALMNIARDTGMEVGKVHDNRKEWSLLSKNLGVKLIQISEIDTQVTNVPKKRGEFVNTWSCYGFICEGAQPTELGWGTHEKELPFDGYHHNFGCKSAIYLNRPGIRTKVRTWTPSEKNFHGFLITHNESISLSDYFTVKDENESLLYRPTVHYAYHPCDSAIVSLSELDEKNFEYGKLKTRVLTNEITDGMDELGVLICGHSKNAYWYGSQLTIQQARNVAPYVSATSLQVCVAVLSAFICAIEKPNEGILEAEDLDFKRVLEISTPYLGNLVGEYTDWNPLKSRSNLGYPDVFDTDDPWQFKNVRVY